MGLTVNLVYARILISDNNSATRKQLQSISTIQQCSRFLIISKSKIGTRTVRTMAADVQYGEDATNCRK